LDLEARADTARAFERDFWRKFEALAPAVLGPLLDGVSGALRRFPETRLASKPRMADFARWVEAAALEPGFAPGEFLASYEATQTDRTNRERGKWSIRIVPETAQVDDGGDARDAPFSSVGMPPRHMFEGEL